MVQDIRVELTKNKRVKPDMKSVKFGKSFSDHMFLMNYEEGKGWFDPRIVPYGPVEMDMATMVFHYGQEIFEGMKAYRTAEGKVQLFRPLENIRRMAISGERLVMPPVDEDMFLEALKKLIEVDAEWVPSEEATSLYIRPFMIATDVGLGVHASKTYLFCIITCPVGSYYPEGLNPIKIMIESQDVRAVRGGTGIAKCGGNYAASLRASLLAEYKGYSQVLWLDGVERKYIEEVGSMNIMFKVNGEVLTPSLTGSVLAGITRKSCIELMKTWGIDVTERLITVDEIVAAAEAGTLEEVWGTGTAAVVSPVGWLTYKDKTFEIGEGQIGKLTQRLYDGLTGIQWGKVPDNLGWTEPVV